MITVGHLFNGSNSIAVAANVFTEMGGRAKVAIKGSPWSEMFDTASTLNLGPALVREP